MKSCYPKQKRKQDTKQRRHTHCTAAGIEDAIAVILDIDTELEILELRIRRVHEILKLVRAGPHAYIEKPAGERLTIRRLK
jgi:hypothetical protein